MTGTGMMTPRLAAALKYAAGLCRLEAARIRDGARSNGGRSPDGLNEGDADEFEVDADLLDGLRRGS